MSFTLTFSPSLGTSDPINVITSESITLVFDTSDNGATYTLTSSSGTITALDGFSGQTWSTSLTSVTNIPSSVIYFGNSAFYLCTSLSSIDIPSSVIGFNINALNSTNISSLILPSNLDYISVGAFYGCASLTSITIPSSVTEIKYYAFGFCSSLTSVTILSNSITYFDDNLFNGCTSLVSINIPSSVTNIYHDAFRDCTSLSSITIPNSITTIRYSTFYNCSALTSITIPNSVGSIEYSAFQNCTSLSSINIPDSITSIGAAAFQGIPNVNSTIVTTPISPTPSYAYTWFHTEPDFSNYYNNITFQNPPPIPCFNKDSKILTDKGYVLIQDLRKGDLVKTFKHGYKPINMIGYREINNIICEERIKDKLYVCKQSEYPEIFEDLIITGCHAILVDNFKEGQREKTAEVLTRIFVTDNKYRLPACVDDRTKPYEKEGKFTIFHLALENDDYLMNYGIYANGLLVETCSKRYLKELSHMQLIE
jgi:hypothetical protein